MNRAQSYHSIIQSGGNQHHPGYQQNQNYYGLATPRSKEKKNLIDEIIHKCQKIQPPRVSLSKCSSRFTSPGVYSRAIENKENSLDDKSGLISENPLERLSNKRFSLGKNHFNNSSRSSIQSSGRQKNNNNSVTQRPTSMVPSESEEYYQKNAPMSPHILNANKPPIFRPSSQTHQMMSPKKTISFMQASGFYSSSVSQNLQKKALDLKKKIEQERQEHVEHCKNEERKLRLFYVQLQNKLCEVRTKDLQVLAEYQASKLQEYDSCLKQIEKQSSISSIGECQRDIERMKRQFLVRFNDSVNPDIQSCLATGISGVLFSFDQTTSGQ